VATPPQWTLPLAVWQLEFFDNVPGTRWAAPAASGSHVGHAKCPCHAQQALHICNKTNSFVSFLAKL
jgi:hypothetical protein